MASNAIQKLDEDIFFDLESLEDLDLSYNKVKVGGDEEKQWMGMIKMMRVGDMEGESGREEREKVEDKCGSY